MYLCNFRALLQSFFFSHLIDKSGVSGDDNCLINPFRTLVADGTPALDYSQLCTLCLDMLIKICQYYPSRSVIILFAILYHSSQVNFITLIYFQQFFHHHWCFDILLLLCRISQRFNYEFRNEDGAVIRPLPRCKRMLSDTLCLPHIVQLLLTFEPNIVERTSKLLGIIMQVLSPIPALTLALTSS